MTSTYENGTFVLIQTFIENEITGSFLLTAMLLLGLVVILLLATRMPPKFVLIFSMIGVVSIFGMQVDNLGGYLPGQYIWVVVLGAIFLFMGVFYVIYQRYS